MRHGLKEGSVALVGKEQGEAPAALREKEQRSDRPGRLEILPALGVVDHFDRLSGAADPALLPAARHDVEKSLKSVFRWACT